MKTLLTEIQQAKASYDHIEAECCEDEQIKCQLEELKYVLEYLNQRINFLRDDFNYVYNELMEHKYEGHFPKINSTEQMQRILEVLGLEKEYRTEPKLVVASIKHKKHDKFIVE